MNEQMQIIIRIQPNGEVQVEVEGVKGESCLTLTKLLEEKLGQVIERQLTSEYYEQVQQHGYVSHRLDQNL